MSIGITTDASFDFVTLQNSTKNNESLASIRLTKLTGTTVSGLDFNAHTYESVNDNNLPFSKLFEIPGGGSSASDPKVKAWIAKNPTQKVVFEDKVFIKGLSTTIAGVR